MVKKNLFIVLEGIDGSGKSTQAKLLTEKLEHLGHKVYITAEPTKSPMGVLIRDIFNHKMEADHKVIAGLFVADRLHHLTNKVDGVLQKLAEGYTVIMDRYYFSSYAYHSAHMDMQWVIDANRMSAELLRPDINIFIDIPVEISMERIVNNRTNIELYETQENQTKVREKYFEAFHLLNKVENIFITNGDRDEEEIAADIWERVCSLD